MIKPMDRVKVGLGLLIMSMMILSPIASRATDVENVAEPLNGEYPCHTECKLQHNHQTEICEIDHYGKFLDWSSIPYSWEENNHNEDGCWKNGIWFDNLKYTTPQGKFDIDVRHKVALYCDGEYLYLNVTQATTNTSGGMGNDLAFTIDGQSARFRLESPTGGVTNPGTAPGKYELNIIHEGWTGSDENKSSAEGYLYVNDTGRNSEYELKIPLTELKLQNSNIDLDNINEISFMSHNFMLKPLVSAGISTYPYLLGLLCAAGVGFILYKKSKKRKG